jgi:DNA-binding beta-propeller fold protein YncE
MTKSSLLPHRITACSPLLFCLALRAAAAPAQPLLIPGPTIEIPNSPGKFDFLEIDSKTHRLLAAHETDGTADFFDLNDNKLITRVDLGGAPVHVATDPKTGNYFVSAQEGQRVVVISGKTLKATNSIPMAGALDAILFIPKNRCVYVANDEGTHVWVINADTEKLVGDITIPGVPEYMVYDAPTDRIYLNIKDKDEVVTIDPAKNVVVAHWPVAPATSPHGLALDSATGRLFSAGANGILAIIDIKTGKTIGTAKIAEKVDQATFDPSTRRIYCAAVDWLSVVQETAEGAEFLGNIKTAATARNVTVDPKTHAVWTTYTDGTKSYAKSWTPVQ